MSVKDYVSTATRLKQTLVYDPKEFLSMLSRIVKDRGFSGYFENVHHEFNNPDGTRTIILQITTAKKVDPYVRLCIDIGVKAIVHDVAVEKEEGEKTMAEGAIEIEFTSYILRDIEDEWGYRNKNPTRRFLRELYDKFLNVDRMATHEKRLKSDLDAIVSDVKSYIKINQAQ